MGRASEADAPSAQAVAIAREFSETATIVDRLDDRARILSSLGRFDDALAHSQEAISTNEGIRARLVPLDFLKRGFDE